MTVSPDFLLRYRRKRMVTGPWRLQGNLNRRYDACIVIPALAEAQTLPHTLHSLSQNEPDLLERTLIAVVVNRRADTDTDHQKDNRACLTLLQQNSRPGLRLAWIDATSAGLELPANQGVGLARKIGFDLCLERLDWRKAPFLVSLDADTRVAQNYLSVLYSYFNGKVAGGAVIPFRHSRGESPAHEHAIRRYELFLRSYTYGLMLAGSPYAYASIGSAFACTAEAYIKSGGMNRRLAAEDFYFLQQLNKVSAVGEIRGTLVYPSPRSSFRVPFGTGRTIDSLVEARQATFTFCSPAAFNLLKQLLQRVESDWQLSATDLIAKVDRLDTRIRFFLENLNFAQNWHQLQQNHSSRNQFLRGFHGWFDALRTRQLLTQLTGEPESVPLQLVNDLFRWGGLQEQQTESHQLAILEQLQGVPPVTRTSSHQ